MQLNRWGAYFCYSDADRKVDADKFENFAPNVTVGTESEYDILDFAKKVKERGWEHLIVSDCNEPVRFYEHIKGTQIHFLDLQEKCFRPHIDSDQAHNKALQMLRTEMRLAQIKAKTSIPVNLLRAGGGITIYTDQVEGLKLANILKDLDGLKVVIPTNAKDIVPPKDFHGKKADLISVTGRLGALNMTMETDPGFIRLPQKKVQYQTDQLIILTQTPPPNIKKRTGVYLCPDLEKISLENIAIQVRALVGTFKKEEHLKYNSDICAGGEKELNGCERCITACPYDAISRDDTNTLRVKVEHMACEGCGGCVAACPTSSLTYLKPSSEEIYTRIATLQNPPLNDERAAPEQMILFHCEEMGKKTLQHAGQVPLSYSANILPVEVPCLRYVSEANMLAALKMGAAGVGLLGCENCTHGERDLLYQKYEFARMILHHFDLGEDRIRIITAEEGEEEEVIEIINRFNTQLHKAVFPSEGKSPFKTGNREVLAQILAGFIEQTKKEPGGIKIPADLPYSWIDVDENGCTLCRSCANVCPTHAFKFEEATNSLHFKHINCIGCKLCYSACPENVITISAELYLEKLSLDYLKVAEDEMVKCEKCGDPYIGRKALDKVETKIFALEALKSTFSGTRKYILRKCPDCRAIDAMNDVNQGWEP